MDELVKGNHIHRKEYFPLLEKLEQRGYMEESGDAWASPRAAELDEMCQRVMASMKKIEEGCVKYFLQYIRYLPNGVESLDI